MYMTCSTARGSSRRVHLVQHIGTTSFHQIVEKFGASTANLSVHHHGIHLIGDST